MKNKNVKSVLIIFIFLLFPSFAFAVIPEVNKVSGTIATGQVLTITGTNMVNENKTNWDKFFSSNLNAYSFEGSNPSSDGYIAASGPGVYDTTKKILGSKSMKFSVGPNNPPNEENVENYWYYNISEATPERWYRYYIKYNVANSVWFDNYAKQLYLMQGGGNYYLDVDGTSNRSMPNIMKTTAGSTGMNTYGEMPNGPLENNRWYVMEVYTKGGSTQSARRFDVYMDGKLIIQTPASVLNENIATWYVLFGIPNAKTASAGMQIDCWWDGLVDSATRIYPSSTIEVSGDGSNWKYQEPLFLSETSSQIKLDLSGLIGTNYRLRVTNNRQQISNIYNLSGSDNTPPVAPSGLNIL